MCAHCESLASGCSPTTRPYSIAGGELHPFPLRIGIGSAVANTLPASHVRVIHRLEYPLKHVLALEAFGSSIATEPRELAHIVVAHRRLGVRAALQPLPRRTAIGPLMRDGVVGLGVAQMIEWTFQRGARDLIGKMGTARFRMACCGTALAPGANLAARDRERPRAELECGRSLAAMSTPQESISGGSL